MMSQAAAHHVIIKRAWLLFQLGFCLQSGKEHVCLHAPHTFLHVNISSWFWYLPHLLLTGKLSNVLLEQESLQGPRVLQDQMEL